MTTDRNAFRFFLEHAGYATPPGRAACALELARAEAVLEEAVELELASVDWLDDSEPYDPGDAVTEDEARELFESGAWTGPYGCRVRLFAEPAELDGLPHLERVADAEASLWGIVLDSRGIGDDYARVVAAELASELVDELRQAVGDARDAELDEVTLNAVTSMRRDGTVYHHMPR